MIDEKLERGESDFQSNDLAKQTSLLDAIHLLSRSWTCVTETTIRNCFRKGGFEANVDDDLQCEPIPIPNDIDQHDYEEWLTVDDDLPTTANETEDEIVAGILSNKEEVEEEEEEEGSEDIDVPPSKPPSFTEMRKALDTLQKGFETYAGTSDEFDCHYKYMNIVNKMIEKNLTQKKVTDYFS